jgi:hypothetical protein
VRPSSLTPARTNAIRAAVLWVQEGARWINVRADLELIDGRYGPGRLDAGTEGRPAAGATRGLLGGQLR